MLVRREQSRASSEQTIQRGRVSGYLRVADVADDLGVSPRTVLRWIERGEIEALRLPGGGLRISQTAYSAWQASRTTSTGDRILAAVDEGGEGL